MAVGRSHTSWFKEPWSVQPAYGPPYTVLPGHESGFSGGHWLVIYLNAGFKACPKWAAEYTAIYEKLRPNV